MTEQDFNAFIDRAKWNWATTYAKFAPHYYCVRQEFKDDAIFDEVVQYIRDNSLTAFFHGKKFQYCFHNGWKYWTMGNPIEQTRIINRAKI